MKRIKKTSQYIANAANLSNVYGTSISNGYTQEYINNKVVGNHLVVFGDSWTDEAVSQGFGGIGWVKKLEYKTGIITHNYAINGAAFGNGLFDQQVNTFIADTSFNHKLIDKIIFMGGINDYHLNLTGQQTANNFISTLSNLFTNGNLKNECKIYFINNWSFINGNYTDATTQITSNDTLEAQMDWYHDFFANINSFNSAKVICINSFKWYPYSAWNNTFYHVTESYKENYQWQQIYSAIYGGTVEEAPYLMKINTDFGNIIYKINERNSIIVEANVWNNQSDMSLTISHNVPYQVDLLKTSNGSVISTNGTTITFVNTGVQQIGYGKFIKYSSYSDIINGSVTAS